MPVAIDDPAASFGSHAALLEAALVETALIETELLETALLRQIEAATAMTLAACAARPGRSHRFGRRGRLGERAGSARFQRIRSDETKAADLPEYR